MQSQQAPVVLVVEDDAAIRALTTLVLEDEGYLVVGAGDGRAALAALDALEPRTVSAVVLDLQLPVMDGRAFFRALRASGRDIPVLIMSAFGGGRAQAELGAEDSIEKPFDVDVLVAHVRALTGSAP